MHHIGATHTQSHSCSPCTALLPINAQHERKPNAGLSASAAAWLEHTAGQGFVFITAPCDLQLYQNRSCNYSSSLATHPSPREQRDAPSLLVGRLQWDGEQWAGMGAADLGSHPCWDSGRDRDGNGNSDRDGDRDRNVSACSSQHVWSCSRLRTDAISTQ